MRRVLLVIVLLAAACHGGDEGAPAAAPPPDGGVTLIVAPGYGPLYALDLDTWQAQAFPDTDGVPGDYQYRLTAVDGGVALPGGDTVRFLPLSLEGPSRSLGDAWIYVPSGHPGRIWLVTDESGSVTEVDGDGEVTVPTTPLPADAYVVGGVGDQLVVQTGAHLQQLGLVTPGRSDVEPLVGQELVAASGDRLATMLPGGADRLQLLDVATGDEVEVELDEQPSTGGFSPDGTYLALWVREPGGGHLELVDTTTGEVAAVPASSAGDYARLTWSPDGRAVFLLASPGLPEPTLLRYRLGDERATSRVVPHLQVGTVVAVDSTVGPDLDDPDAPTCPESGGPDHNGNPLPALTTDGPCRLP